MSGPACLAGSAGPAEAPRASAGPRRLGFVALTAALALAAAPAAAQTTGPAVVVPDVDAPLATGQPYPLQLSIAGRQIVEDVDLRVTRLYHEQPDELDMLLVGPGGESTLILSDVGASAAVTGGTFRFDDEALGPVSDLLLSGSYRPTDLSDDPPDVIPAPAPSGPYGSSLSVFDNTVADGVWNLYVVDDTAFDGGQILAVSLSVNGRPARRLTPHAERATIAEDPGAVATIRVRRTAARRRSASWRARQRATLPPLRGTTSRRSPARLSSRQAKRRKRSRCRSPMTTASSWPSSSRSCSQGRAVMRA
jgi:hypothetical protein